MPIDSTAFTQAGNFTCFHSPHWLSTLLEVFPQWRDRSSVQQLPDGRLVYLPLLETYRLGPWRWLESMPFGFIGGPLVLTGKLDDKDLKALLSQTEGAGWLAFNFDPCAGYDFISDFVMGRTTLTTHLLELEPPFEQVFRGFNKTMRYDMRRAERMGVTARRGYTEADFLRYYDLLQFAAQRWNVQNPPFPPRLFRALAGLPPAEVRLWLAEYNEQIIGGLINIHYTSTRVLHWTSALHPDYAHLNPTKLLQYKAIHDACEEGIQIYNLGPSVGFDGKPLEGVRQAKEALGARPQEYAILILQNRWAMRARAVQARLRPSRG